MAAESVLDFWKNKWTESDIPWHREAINDSLIKYKDLLIENGCDVQIFVPMCGKSVDMKWLYDLGYKVVGVDCCEKAAKDFFTENSLDFSASTLKSNVILYESADGRLKIYVCDIFDFKKDYAGLMNVVYDRGALVALEKEDRIKYVENVMSILAPGFRYLLITYDYKDWFYSYCPRSVPRDLVRLLYKCNVEELEVRCVRGSFVNDIVQAEEVNIITWLITDVSVTK